MLTKKNAFAVWLLVGLTLGIYGLVVYERLNSDLHAAHQAKWHSDAIERRPAWSRWWSQFVPVYGLVGLHRTAHELNIYAGRKVASPVATWLWWSWFVVGSYPYLQHAANKAVS